MQHSIPVGENEWVNCCLARPTLSLSCPQSPSSFLSEIRGCCVTYFESSCIGHSPGFPSYCRKNVALDPAATAHSGRSLRPPSRAVSRRIEPATCYTGPPAPNTRPLSSPPREETRRHSFAASSPSTIFPRFWCCVFCFPIWKKPRDENHLPEPLSQPTVGPGSLKHRQI